MTTLIEKIDKKGVFLTPDMLSLLKLAIPIIGSMLLQMTYNLTDMIWVGRLGSNAVASVGTAGFFINLGWALASIVTMGANVKVAHSVGAKKCEEAGKFATTGISSILIMALLFSGVLFAFAHDLIGFFKLNNSQVESDAVSYMNIMASGIPLVFVGLLFTSIFNAYGLTRLSFRASMVGTIINIVLDPLFIFTFKLGIDGAAIATIIARSISVVFFLYLIFKQKKVAFAKFNIYKSHLKEILIVGIPTSIQRVAFIVIYIFIARIIAEWGPVAIAVQKVGIQIESFTFMFVGGLAQAMAVAVGQTYGAGKFDEIPGLYKSGLKLAVAVGVLTTIMFIGIPELLFSIFINEPESIRMGSSYLVIIGVSQLFMCVEMITTGTFNGLGKTNYPAIVSVIFTTIRVPAAYLLGFYTFLELEGVWWSISGSSILKGIVSFILFRYIFKKISNIEFNKQTVEDEAVG